jgi:hypothetical protein
MSTALPCAWRLTSEVWVLLVSQILKSVKMRALPVASGRFLLLVAMHKQDPRGDNERSVDGVESNVDPESGDV